MSQTSYVLLHFLRSNELDIGLLQLDINNLIHMS